MPGILVGEAAGALQPQVDGEGTVKQGPGFGSVDWEKNRTT